jgi:hypothetical protein
MVNSATQNQAVHFRQSRTTGSHRIQSHHPHLAGPRLEGVHVLSKFKIDDFPPHVQEQIRAQLADFAKPVPQMPTKPVADLPDIPFDDVPEKEIQKLCEGYLRQRGIWFLHLSPMAREKIGVPDLLFSINGRSFAIELKTVTGRVTVDQERTHAEMKANGWTVEVIRSTQAFIDFIKKMEVTHA